ncbi:unnamed protein product [Paramecium sonneborni]|uniref:Uncharacterized protein n=1 Tax=Paramecium sonneborni TaxID=65129 RepID=A0A8S1P0V2_9CILI|nr:unnamed protein product [Paramecium sonneborni]
MNSLIRKYFNQIKYGNFDVLLRNSERVLGVGSLVLIITQFLNDKELLQKQDNYQRNIINQTFEFYKQDCKDRHKFQMQKQKYQKNYIQDPEYLNIKHNNNYMFYSFNNISMEQKQYIKIQDLLNRKKKQTQQCQIQQEQRIQVQQKQIELTQQKQINDKQNVEKKIELEKLISEVYSLLSEEEPKTLPKPNLRLNDITKNLCPIVQYQRVKQLAQKLRGSQQQKNVNYI